MCRFSMGVAALALAASGALAQNSDQPAAEQAAPQNVQQRGGPPGADRTGNGRNQRGRAARSGDAGPPAAERRPLRDTEPDAQQVENDKLTSRDRRETRSLPQTPTDQPADRRPENPSDRIEPAERSEAGRRGFPLRGGDERLRKRMFTGPLDRSAQLLADCPRGLAKSGGCASPGPAKSRATQSKSTLGFAYSPRLFGLTGFDAGRYLYRDGYLLRLAGTSTNGGRIAGYIPLLGGALASGNVWPGSYGSRNVPAYLVDFYNLGEPGSYRYADNTLYRVDPQSAAIQSVAALLTDDAIALGEPMPAGYEVYNIPQPYRERYADTARAAYRYADGYVYRFDPETRLVTAAIDLLT